MTRIRSLRPWVASVIFLFFSLVVLSSSFTSSSQRRRGVPHVSASATSEAQTSSKLPSTTANGIQGPIRQVSQSESNEGEEQKSIGTPWRASYHVSKKTQQKIQQAAIDMRGARRSNVQRASAVLEAFLKTAPENCNAANLVCALTLSAKELGSHGKPNAKFRSLLCRALDVLHELVDGDCMHSRQLCNAVWAVAKHYDRDPQLLPAVAVRFSVSADKAVVSETWDLSEDDDSKEMSPEEKLDVTVEKIARQLASVLRTETEEHAKQAGAAGEDDKRRSSKETKLGEICMASWAFGMLRPRLRPPGWLEPPKMGKLEKQNEAEEAKPKRRKNRNDFMSYEQWTLTDYDLSFLKPDGPSLEVTCDDSKPKDATDAVFDAIADALCRPIKGETLTESSVHEPQFHLMRVTECKWNEIANLAWAFEKRGRCLSNESEMLLRALSREAAWRLQRGGTETRYMLSRDISQLIWALGTLQQDNFRLAHDLVALVEDFSQYLGLEGRKSDSRPFENWSCPDIVQIILSLSHARIDDSHLLLALFEEAHFRLSDNGISSQVRRQDGRKVFLAWEVCVVLWAQARLHLTSSEGSVYGEFPRQATSSLLKAANECGLREIGIEHQEQANLAWSLTVLQHHQSDEAVELLQRVFSEAAKTTDEDGFIQLEHAHQLWQALFLLEEESPSAVSNVPTWFRDYLSDKWNLEKSKKKISSARHKSISDVLNLMGVAHVNEHDEDIDVAIVLKSQASWAHETGEGADGMKVAVEFDGPNHFTRKGIARDNPTMASKPVRALGHTVLKYRLLKRKGWTVVRVPYYEFDKIPFWASMERQRYLQRLLKTHANIQFSTIDVSEYRSLAPNRKTRFD